MIEAITHLAKNTSLVDTACGKPWPVVPNEVDRYRLCPDCHRVAINHVPVQALTEADIRSTVRQK